MGSEGVGSGSAADRQAADAALGSAMMENAEGVHPLVLPHLSDLLDRSQHDALPPSHILIFKTPPGECCQRSGQHLSTSAYEGERFLQRIQYIFCSIELTVGLIRQCRPDSNTDGHQFIEPIRFWSTSKCRTGTSCSQASQSSSSSEYEWFSHHQRAPKTR